MDIDSVDKHSEDKMFFNHVQVLEHVISLFINDIGEIESFIEEDDCTMVEVVVNDEKFNIIITYLLGALILDTGTSSLTLHYKNYVLPFNKKSYSTKNKKFSNLLYQNSLRNLYSCVKSQFIKSPTVFSHLPKGVLSEILMFLDKKSLVNLLCVSKDLNQLIDRQETWKCLYCLKYGFGGFNLPLNWKSIYLTHNPNIPLS